MKAIVFERYGSPEVLQMKEVEKPIPKDHEVLIKVHAITVVKGDCELRRFDFPWWFWLPLRIYVGLIRPTRVKIPGQELAGEIEAVGKDVTTFKKGDQVLTPTSATFGAYVQFKSLPADGAIALKPDSINYLEAASIPTGGLNALHYIRLANIQAGEKVLINGACGNIGSFAVQLANHFGAEVTGVDRGDKLEVVRSMGANRVIDYTREDFTKSGAAYDVIFDVIGTCHYSRCLKLLRPKGRFLNANPRVSFMIRSLFTPLVSDKRVMFRFAPYRSEDLSYLADLMATGKIKPFIDKQYSFDQIREAHAYLDSGDKKGNVVVTVEH